MNNDSWDDYKSEIKKAEQVAIKKFDETCEKIVKNEPKVWLTVDEAKKLNNCLHFYYDFGTKKYEPMLKLQDGIELLGKRIEQAEKKK